MKPVIAAILLSVFSSLFGGKAHRENERGNREYEAGNQEEALRHYTEAQVPAPDAPELHYDIGNVLYRRDDHEGAAEAYRRALTGTEGPLAPDAAFNLGNALYRQRRFDEAAEAYRRSLEARPADADARRNLELALRALEQQNPSQPQDSGPQDEQKDPDREPQPRPQPQGRDEQEKEGKQDPQPQPRAGEGMSPQDAQRLLDRIGELEKDAMKRRAAQAAQGATAREKDW